MNEKNNGIYSYFIRGTDLRLMPRDLEEIKKYATKVIEARESILIVGKNWIVVVKKIYGYDHEHITVRCFNDVCEPYDEIEPIDVLDSLKVPTTVDIECTFDGKRGENILDYDCRVQYNYFEYFAVIAITIDPLDIHRLSNDKELQLLLDLIPAHRLLVRPM